MRYPINVNLVQCSNITAKTVFLTELFMIRKYNILLRFISYIFFYLLFSSTSKFFLFTYFILLTYSFQGIFFAITC